MRSPQNLNSEQAQRERGISGLPTSNREICEWARSSLVFRSQAQSGRRLECAGVYVRHGGEVETVFLSDTECAVPLERR